MKPHSFIRTLAATALLALPSIAMAAPDQNTNPNRYPNNNGCPNGQWNNNGYCVNNGQYNNGNGQWNNRNGCKHRRHDENDNERGDSMNLVGSNDNGYRGNDDNENNDDRGRRRSNNNDCYNNGGYNNGGYNNGGYNGGYNNGNNGNRGGQLNGNVRAFSPYNLYLSNGTHVVLHDGTVINPRGTNLGPGQRVRVIGTWNQDRTFSATEIDVLGNGYGYYR